MIVEASFWSVGRENVEVEAESRRASGWGGPLLLLPPNKIQGVETYVCKG